MAGTGSLHEMATCGYCLLERLSVVIQRSNTAFIEASPTSFQPVPWQWLSRIFAQERMHVCLIRHNYILCIIFFFIIRNNVYVSDIYLALPMHYYLHPNCIGYCSCNCWQLDRRDRSKDTCKDPWHFWNTEHRSSKWDSAWFVNQHNNRDITATSANCRKLMTFVC